VSIDGALSIATGGLANISNQMAVVSQNVANAGTPGYAVETSTQQSISGNGEGLGVQIGPAILTVNTAMQTALYNQNATVAGLQTQQSALQAIDAVQGTPGQGGDIGSLLGNLQNQFSTLLNDPSNPTQQSQVVSTATALTQGINALSNTYTAQRQTAQNSIVSEVGTLNSALGTISSLGNQITALQADGQSTADLENQRNVAVTTLSHLLNVKVLEQPNGSLLITTASGLTLPTNSTANPVTTGGANVQPGTWYPGGGIPPIMLGGTDITRELQGGQLGANIALRDTTLPTDQAELDEFSQNLASRFNAQGLTLFSDPTGAVPVGGGIPVQSGYVGFATTIQVNPAVLADPSAVRDGTPSTSGGLAGFTGIINQVLNDALGDTPALVSNVTGLGASGTLSAPYAAPDTLGQLASTVVASQAQDSATVTTQLGTEQAVQTTLSGNLSTQSGVNMDTEMSTMIQLQNAYGENAKVIAAVQSMWTQLLATVQ
jgi:flagellar hook-associated protein 1